MRQRVAMKWTALTSAWAFISNLVGFNKLKNGADS